MDDELSIEDAADFMRLSVLTYLAEYMNKEGVSDLTQVDDDYILRQMAKYNCFSITDVYDTRDKLAQKLGATEKLPPRPPIV